MRSISPFLLAVLATIAGCATPPAAIPLASPLPAAAPPPSPSYGNLVVPPRLADGSYVTPNRNVSPAGAVWHLRAGLNVAALSCRGSEEATLIAGYNLLLERHRAAFDQAYRALAGEHGEPGTFDSAMTALYNYYALPAAQSGLCAAAQRVLADAALVPAGRLAEFAPAALASLERPYTIVFAAREAWLATRYTRTGEGTVLFAAAAASPTPPRLTIDPAVLRIP